jgi:hypothetical protein
MALVKVKLLEPHYTSEGRYLPAGTVVDWDDTRLNTNMIPAPNVGAATNTATTSFNNNFDKVAAPIPGHPGRYKRRT